MKNPLFKQIPVATDGEYAPGRPRFFSSVGRNKVTGELVPLTLKRGMKKIGRNAPCICGSGEKYKNCCGR